MNITISDLYIYPIKSCAGVRLERSQISARGLQWDREWIIVDQAGRMATQRRLPQLALITPRISETHLHLTAPGMVPFMISLDAAFSAPIAIQVWQDQVLGSDEGDAVASWLSQYLNSEGASYRLLRIHPEAQRHIDIAWLNPWQRKTQRQSATLRDTEFAFADGFPFLICNKASLDALNVAIQEQGDAAIRMERFRPNIVISGIEAYAEDNLLSLEGEDYDFAKLKNCTRCKLPNVDPLTAEVGHQPWDALMMHRRFPSGVWFGINAGLSRLGDNNEIYVGQGLRSVSTPTTDV